MNSRTAMLLHSSQSGSESLIDAMMHCLEQLARRMAATRLAWHQLCCSAHCKPPMAIVNTQTA
jgi:hypothetical protein